jgi:hypothetical protein
MKVLTQYSAHSEKSIGVLPFYSRRTSTKRAIMRGKLDGIGVPERDAQARRSGAKRVTLPAGVILPSRRVAPATPETKSVLANYAVLLRRQSVGTKAPGRVVDGARVRL